MGIKGGIGMEEVIKSLKAEFEKRQSFQINVPITDLNYPLKSMEIRQSKASFAIEYLQSSNKVNKKQALSIIFDILQGKI